MSRDWKEQLELARRVLRMDGEFIGSFGNDEYVEACFLIEQGYAARSYSGVGGFLGLGKLKVTDKGRELLNDERPSRQ